MPFDHLCNNTNKYLIQGEFDLFMLLLLLLTFCGLGNRCGGVGDGEFLKYGCCNACEEYVT